MFSNPAAPNICETLSQVTTIAVVGLSPKPNRPSFSITRAMQRVGYRIVPVHPLAEEVLSERAYGSLKDIPFQIDLVNVFRAANAIEGIVDECIALRLPRLWIQEGIVNEQAAARAAKHGVWTVMDRCIWRDYNGLCGAPARTKANAR